MRDRAGGSVRAAVILTRYGGIEIAETIDRTVRARNLDVALAHRLADAVSGRDKSMQFDIFNRQALDMLAEAASAAALSGDTEAASRLSEGWQETRVAIDEAETYNLDRKQHALNTIVRLQETFRM